MSGPTVPTDVMPGAEPFAFPGGAARTARTGVLLVHGFTGTPMSMRPWGEHLAAEGFAVRCPLLPGHGTRWQDCNTSTHDQWTTAVGEAFDALAAECDRVFVAGLSMGGTLATRLAEVRPDDVAGLLLVNPALLTQRLDAKLLPMIARLTGSWAPIASDIKKPGVTELAYPKLPTRAMMQLRPLWAATRADLRPRHRAGDRLPQRRGPRRRAGQQPGAARRHLQHRHDRGRAARTATTWPPSTTTPRRSSPARSTGSGRTSRAQPPADSPAAEAT